MVDSVVGLQWVEVRRVRVSKKECAKGAKLSNLI